MPVSSDGEGADSRVSALVIGGDVVDVDDVSRALGEEVVGGVSWIEGEGSIGVEG